MPRRSILSAVERESLLALPDSKDDLIRHYRFSDADPAIIRQRRGEAQAPRVTATSLTCFKFRF